MGTVFHHPPHAVVHIAQQHEADKERYERVQQVNGQAELNQGHEFCRFSRPVGSVLKERLANVEQDDADEDDGEQARKAAEKGCYSVNALRFVELSNLSSAKSAHPCPQSNAGGQKDRPSLRYEVLA